jgi:hypothetical protein
MRIAGAFAAFVIASICAPGTSQAREYPWCAELAIEYDYVANCGFDTWAQCMATVSGIGGYCRRNFQYTAQPERPPPRKPAKKPPQP